MIRKDRAASQIKQPGFTIVELLIVVVVIGILAAIVIVSYNGITQAARDSQRQGDIATVVKAIRLYEAKNGRLPTEAEGANGKIGQGGGLDTLLVPEYISAIPKDPLADSTHYYYYDGAHGCGGHTTSAVIFAYNTDTDIDGQGPCSSYGGEGSSDDEDDPNIDVNIYHIRLGDSDG